MIKLADVQTEDSDGYIDLEKLVGQKIKRVLCHPFDEGWGAGLQVWGIELEDGSLLYAEGEHDLAYLVSPYGRETELNMDEETLGRFYDEWLEDLTS